MHLHTDARHHRHLAPPGPRRRLRPRTTRLILAVAVIGAAPAPSSRTYAYLCGRRDSRGRVAPSQRRRSPQPSLPCDRNVIFAATAAVDDDDDDGSGGGWDGRMRREAADALLPALLPRRRGEDDGGAAPPDAEKALKRLLRTKYQRTEDQSVTSTTGGEGEDGREERRQSTIHASRSKLSALILGTSVMRLRHMHSIAADIENRGWDSFASLATLPSSYRRNGSSTVAGNAEGGVAGNSSENTEEEERRQRRRREELLFVRALVDEHALYLRDKEDDGLSRRDDDWPIDLAERISARRSLPPFLASALVSQYGFSEADRMGALMNRPGPITIRKNSAKFKGSDEDLCKLLWDADGVRAEPLAKLLEKFPTEVMATEDSGGEAPFHRRTVGAVASRSTIRPPGGCIRIIPSREKRKSIWGMHCWRDGYFEVQDAGSQIIVESVEARPGEKILDFCAGNGGKLYGLASAIAAHQDKKGSLISNDASDMASFSRLVAHDIVDERLRQIKGSLRRTGLDSKDAVCRIEVTTSSDLEGMPADFDAVLVDAPCSSTGALRRRPSQRWDISEECAHEILPTSQLEILKKASSFVRKGGRLVYATCSVLREENEGVDFSFRRSEEYRQGGFAPWNFGSDKSLESEAEFQNMISLIPTELGSDGFFIARWKRED